MRPRRELVDVELDDLRVTPETGKKKVFEPKQAPSPPGLQRVDHQEEIVLTQPDLPAPTPTEVSVLTEASVPADARMLPAPPEQNSGWGPKNGWGLGRLVHRWTCDGCPRCAPPCDALAYDPLPAECGAPGCDSRGCAGPGLLDPEYGHPGCIDPGCIDPGCIDPGCEPIGCDALGSDCRVLHGAANCCDAIGCNCARCQTPPWYRSWTGPMLSGPVLGLHPGQWFGKAELLLLWRRGDRTPPLVTTGPGVDPDTDGELGQPGTQVLAGVDSILKDMQAGARFTFGVWLDGGRHNSLVFRSWIAGEEKYSFGTNTNINSVIARPFLDVTDATPVEQDTFLVSFPGRANGSISLQGVSELNGLDIAVRQFWYAQCNHTVELLYGYQYMQLNESLLITNSSVSEDAAFAPIGSVISIADAFNAENDFHGAQFGIASHYREGCWSFDMIAKLAFGSLRRRAIRSGVTTTALGGATASDPNGLLVRGTNDGAVSDNTFSWVPELDFSIGWRKYPNWDFTFGYFIVGLSDALQVSGTMDPNLAVNLADPPTGQQRPTAALRFNSYYAQGLQFGVKHVY